MAITYANLPVAGGTRGYIGYFNSIREAISRRAAQIGATVTLPDTIVAGDDVYTKFGPWLKKCRVAIETILTAGKYGRMVPGTYPYQYSFVFEAWTKATLMDYIQNRVPEWVHNPYSQWHDWMGYVFDPWPTPADTPLYAGYVNEIYYALELLCMTRHYISPAAVSNSAASASVSGKADATAAYDDAVAALSFAAGTADLTASSYARVVGGGSYSADLGGDQETEWTLTIPNLSYSVTRILVLWEDISEYTSDSPHYKRATSYNAASYGGSIGQWMGGPYAGDPANYTGYKYWSGLNWNNEARSFSHKWANTNPFTYLYSERGTTYAFRQERSTPQGESIFYTTFGGYLNEAWAPWSNDSWNLEAE